MSEKYGLHPAFEEVVLWYCSSSPKFWSSIGQHLVPEACETTMAPAILNTCRQLAKEAGGTGPSSPLLIVQRMSRLVAAGKITQATVQMANDVYERVEELPEVPKEDQVINEMVPVLRRQMEWQATEAAIDQVQKGGDFEQIRKRLDVAATLGQVGAVQTHQLGRSSFDEIAAVRQLERMSYGVPELDANMEGGSPRKSLCVWLADSGAGKSQHLINNVSVSMRSAMTCGMVTLELPKHVQMARILANLTNVPVSGILENPSLLTEAHRRFDEIAPQMGLLQLTELDEQQTTVRQINDWVDETEQVQGSKMEVLVVDYADRLRAPAVRDQSEYQVMRQVYEGLHKLAKERDMYVWTASQATRGKDKAKFIDQRHVADSMHKARAADVLISINPDPEDPNMVSYYAAKNRLGRSQFSVGPVFADYSVARVSPFAVELGNW